MLGQDFQAAWAHLGLPRGRLLLAISGGVDSMTLLDLAARCLPALDVELVVAHVNHGLRGEDSEADEAFVQAAAVKLGFAFHPRRIDPEGERIGRSSREKPTLEEASRNLRRQALREIAAETRCDWIATAHHAGDQAETVLLRLLRGTGPDGLAGMAEKSPDGLWLKPLLRVLPDEIQQWANHSGILWREDKSNEDRRFSRNRLRHDWIPQLSATFNPQLLRTLSDLAEAKRRDLEWIEELVDEASRERIEVADSEILFKLDGWNDVPDALARRLVKRALATAGLQRDTTRIHIARVLAFLRQGRSTPRNKRLELPRGVGLRRLDNHFELSR